MPETSVTATDVLVVGSGPGGAITACLLAEAGRDVVLVEEGPHLPLAATRPFSPDEMRRKYRAGGVTAALGQPAIAYAEARCLGGGSEINSGLYHRTPADVLEQWRRDFALVDSTEDDLAPHFAACEADLGVGPLPHAATAASERLRAGAERLGWRAVEVPRWYRYVARPGGAGWDARKQSMTETYLPRAVAAGCRVVSGVRVTRLVRTAEHWLVSGASMTFKARTVFVAAGAIQTPALLRRSGIRRNVGDTLHLHPTVKVVAEFPDGVNDDGAGVPVHQVKEFAPRLSLGGSVSTPPHLALAMSDHPGALVAAVDAWRRHAVYYASGVGGTGTIRTLPRFDDPLVRYRLDAPALAELGLGMRRLCECLFAAGAIRLYPSVRGMASLASDADLARLPAALPRAHASLMTIHAFSSCPMGEAPDRCATDSFGRVHGVPGLHVADASLLCGPPGVNPQGSVMAVARRNALRFLEGRP